MTITSTPSEVSYQGDDVSTSFPIPYVFDAAADLKVVRTDSDGNTSVLMTGFSVSGGNGSTGTLTLDAPLGAGYRLTIIDDPEAKQDTDYIANDSFPAETHERALDYLTRLVKRLLTKFERTLRVADGDPAGGSGMEIGSVQNRKGKFLYFDDTTGAPTVAAAVGVQPLTQSIIGEQLYPQTAAEIAAGVTPVNYQYLPEVVERYGAAGDGTTVDDDAFTKALAANTRILGTPAKTYVLSSGITIDGSTNRRVIDLKGAIVRPDDNDGRFTSDALTATATSTVSSGASIGSRSVVVASATGMEVGQWVRITESTNAFPAFWGKITSISGTTLEFDRTLPCTYTGTINISTYASLRGSIELRNIVFDGSNVDNTPGNDGHAIRLVGFERVVIEDIELRNYEQDAGGFVIQVLDCVDVEIANVRVVDSSIGGANNFLNIDRARSAIYKDIVIHSGGFGMNTFRCESAIFANNVLTGRRKMEDQENIGTDRSIRGLKAFGCGYVQMIGNSISDYTSPIKIERIHRFLVANNVIRNAALYTFQGDSALSVTSAAAPVEPYGLVCNNLLENCGGNGIGIDSGGGSSADVNVVVSNNVIKDVGRYAIWCENRKLVALGNKIENWNTSNTGVGQNSAAIYYGGGITAIGNTFENSDTTDCCFNTNFVSGEEYCFRDNSRLSGNPYFDGGLVIEYNSGTATIVGGTTSVMVPHGLVRTPSQIEIDLQYATNPSNDPGPIYLSAISATHLTVACRNDPGASFNVHWKARIRQPFTA